jgi:hypothetical protein
MDARLREIRELLHQRPFVPFRLHLADGSRHDIHYFDFALVTTRWVDVAVGAKSAEEMPKSIVTIYPSEIARVEMAKPVLNGRRRRRPTGR